MEAIDQAPIDYEAQNAAVKAWFGDTLRAIRTRYMQMVHSPERSGDGLDSIRSHTRSAFGEIESGSFSFNRYLIFIHKGAGRGYGGQKGSTWTDAKGGTRSTNPLSLGRMNSGARREEPWLNPVLDTQVPKLADIVADFKADAVVKQIQIK